MNTNNFSFKRFLCFFRWFSSVSMHHTLLILSIVAAVAIVTGAVSNWSHFNTDGRIYAVILFVAGGVVASMILSSINKPTVRQQYLSIPSSYLEKYISVMLLTVLRLIAVFAIVAAADGIWSEGQSFATFIDPTILLGYWAINIYGGFCIRKFPFIFTTLICGGFTGSLFAGLRTFLGGESNHILSVEDGRLDTVKIIFLVVTISAVFGCYFVSKRTKLNTKFYQYAKHSSL